MLGLGLAVRVGARVSAVGLGSGLGRPRVKVRSLRVGVRNGAGRVGEAGRLPGTCVPLFARGRGRANLVRVDRTMVRDRIRVMPQG